MTLNQTRSYN